jgi:hypothetical protein
MRFGPAKQKKKKQKKLELVLRRNENRRAAKARRRCRITDRKAMRAAVVAKAEKAKAEKIEENERRVTVARHVRLLPRIATQGDASPPPLPLPCAKKNVGRRSSGAVMPWRGLSDPKGSCERRPLCSTQPRNSVGAAAAPPLVDRPSSTAPGPNRKVPPSIRRERPSLTGGAAPRSTAVTSGPAAAAATPRSESSLTSASLPRRHVVDEAGRFLSSSTI